MKKILFSFAYICICLNLAHAGDVLKISAPPSIWIQQHENKVAGPIIDLLETIFDESKIRIEFIKLPWARSLKFMKSGELDMIPVIFYTNDRAKFSSFSTPFAEVPTSVFVPKGRSFKFETIKDLIGREGIMMRGDSISEEFNDMKKRLSISEVSDYEQAFHMLGSERVEFAVAAKFGFLIHAKRFKCEHLFEALPNPIASRGLHLAFSKKSKFVKYIPRANKKIRELRSSGRMEIIIEEAISKAAEY